MHMCCGVDVAVNDDIAIDTVTVAVAVTADGAVRGGGGGGGGGIVPTDDVGGTGMIWSLSTVTVAQTVAAATVDAA
jgi:hypothetical protein